MNCIPPLATFTDAFPLADIHNSTTTGGGKVSAQSSNWKQKKFTIDSIGKQAPKNYRLKWMRCRE